MENKSIKVSDEDIKKMLDKFNRLLDGKMTTYMNSCVHCGLCADTCHYTHAYPDDPEMLPAAKIDKITSLYRKHKTLLGKLLPNWIGAQELNQEVVEKLIDTVFGRCSMCGRCGLNCSIGLNAGQIIRVARSILNEVGLVPKSLQATVDTALESGNNMAISDEDYVETIEWLEEDLQMEFNNDNLKMPLDKEGANVLYTLNPREPKFFPLSITAMGIVFNAAGEDWTLSSKNYDLTNYGIFTGNDEHSRTIAKRIIEEAKKLNVNKIVLGECGHGYRATRWEAANWVGEKLDIEIISVIELMADYIRNGRIKLDPSKNDKKVTLHDPCNLVRNGGILHEQRYILKNCTTNFVEMIPHGKQNFCCGGGGGMLAMGEYKDRRLEAGKKKAEQIKATGAEIIATPCHNCIDQLTELNTHFSLGVEIKTIGEILSKAIIYDDSQKTE